MSKTQTILFLFAILALGLFFSPMIKIEGFSTNKQDLETPGIYPVSVDKPILDSFPLTGSKDVSDKNYSDIWTEYPEFSKSSYDQITNNLRYVNNPDNGTCIRADMCNALYKNKKTKSNIVTPLPPAEEGAGARVGYYRSEPNMLAFSIPDNENILY
jgi:hypothetical protein